MLTISRKHGYGNIILFLGDDPAETRETIRKIRSALDDIVRALPKNGTP